ncbi:MAG: hypothetical protein K8R69_10520 [Deltaproteobacteria bacterium]|nr:hypothetical protein [Deltaproteobacteria bacterium]
MQLPLHVTILSYLFIFFFMFSIGLRNPFSEALPGKKGLGWVSRALVANVLLVPLAGLLLRRWWALPPDAGVGFMLIAVTPGGLFGLHYAHLAKGDIAYALKLSVVLALAAIVLVPMNIYVFLPTTASSKILDFRILWELFVFAMMPYLLGQSVVRYWASGARILKKILFVLVPLLFVAHHFSASQLSSMSIASVGAEVKWALVALILVSWGFGVVLGGPDLAHCKVLAIDTSMRNVAVCWLIARKSFADANVYYTILAFSGISVSMNLVFALGVRFIRGCPLLGPRLQLEKRRSV